MGFVSERLALGMTVCLQLATEQRRRPWSEQVLPYGLAEMLLITPSRWTLTEASREVRLPGVDVPRGAARSASSEGGARTALRGAERGGVGRRA